MDDIRDHMPDVNCCGEAEHNATQESAELHACKQELLLAKDRYAYLVADVENLKKRADRERMNVMRSAQADVLRDLVRILDDLERAFAQYGNTSNAETISQGLSLMIKNVEKALEKHGVSELQETTIFDPRFHEAMTYVASAEVPAGSIVQVFEKGYLFKGELLRPARVSISQ